MNVLAQEFNETIKKTNPHIYEMLSKMGKALFFPKGILSQGAEAKQKAYKLNATIGIATEGKSVLSLPSLTKYVKNIDPDDYLPYAPSFGVLALREEWKAQIYKKNPSLADKQISLPVVGSGITHGVSILSDMWVDDNDVIVLPDMMWGNYNMTFCVRNNARIVHYKSYDDNLTQFNIDSFEETIKQQAKENDKIVTILNFPHNPTGYSVSTEEAKKIADILIKTAQNGTNVVAACDDAYFGLFFEDSTYKESLFSMLSGADERLLAVKLDGATKEEYAWGIRTGFVTYGICADKDIEKTYKALENKTAGCIRGNISNASHLSQTILLKSLADEKHDIYKQEKFNLLKQRALKVKEVLKDPKFKDAFDVYPFNSGYFMCVRLKDVNAETLRLHLLDNYGTGLISIGENNIRVAFSCLEEEDTETLFDIILSGINDLRG